MKRVAFVALLSLAACHALTEADYIDIGETALQVAKCENEGRACKADGGTNCFDVYEDCLADAGLIDGGR